MDKNNTETDCEITPIENPKRIPLNCGRVLGYNQGHVDIIKKGFIPKTMEDKWYIYSNDNWLFFHRSWTGQGIYKAELKFDNGRYIIDDFYVERDSKIYDNTDDIFDYHILRILKEWGLLDCDCRDMCLKIHNKTEDDTARLWHILGNFFISPEEIEIYELEKATKYPCKEVFGSFDKKVEIFLGFLENLQHHRIIPIEEIQVLFLRFNALAIKMESVTAEISSLIKNGKDINIILGYINKEYSLILSNIDEMQKQDLKYFKNDERYFMFEGLISNLINESNHYRISKETVEKMLSYKEIINDKVFDNYNMVRMDL
jgi:hypothetical protein